MPYKDKAAKKASNKRSRERRRLGLPPLWSRSDVKLTPEQVRAQNARRKRERHQRLKNDPSYRLQQAEKKKRWLARRRERGLPIKSAFKAYGHKRKYGISYEERDALLRAQGGVCAVCQKEPATHLDHNHDNGAVRKLLCRSCNFMLGNAKDNPQILRAGAIYLEQH